MSPSDTNKFVFWDFDGTLATRNGFWGRCLVEILDSEEPGHHIELDQLNPFLRNGFPWHRHEEPHLHLSEPDAWWAEISKLLFGALVGVGYEGPKAAELAGLVRARFLEPSAFKVFEDVVPALELLRSSGWRHLVLSNHAPELETLVKGLPIGDLIDITITSALTGYEKPHPLAFRAAMEAAGHPENVWMVGDNPIADVAGAERAGIPAIWLRPPSLDDAYISHVNDSWGGTLWLDWQNHVSRTAADAEEAASIILGAACGPSSTNPSTPFLFSSSDGQVVGDELHSVPLGVREEERPPVKARKLLDEHIESQPL